MAAITVTRAVQDFWAAGLTFSGKPAKLWFDGVPLVSATGTPVQLPTAEITDNGTTTSADFEHVPVETTRFTVTVRAETLEAAMTIVLGMKYNGAPPTDYAGLDYCRGLAVANCSVLACEPGRRLETTETARGPTANLVYKVTQDYTVILERTA